MNTIIKILFCTLVLPSNVYAAKSTMTASIRFETPVTASIKNSNFAQPKDQSADIQQTANSTVIIFK